jgi:hypothetical protein
VSTRAEDVTLVSLAAFIKTMVLYWIDTDIFPSRKQPILVRNGLLVYIDAMMALEEYRLL